MNETGIAVAAESMLFDFSKDGNFLENKIAVNLKLRAPADSLLALALAINDPLPAGTIKVVEGSARISGDTSDIKFGEGRGAVSFKGAASAGGAIGVYDSAADLLRDLDPERRMLEGLTLNAEGAARFMALSWNYNLGAALKGAMALGGGASLTFGADGKSEGLFAVVRGFAKNPRSQDAIEATLSSWMLPRQARTAADLEPGTWLIAEVDGEIGASLGAQFGFDQTWVRELKGDPKLAGLIGPIGLRVQAAIDATLGFHASGKYVLVIARESLRPQDQTVRVRLFKTARKGWNFAFNAGVSLTGNVGKLKETQLDDFLAGLFGVHGAQLVEDLKEFRKWLDPSVPLPDLFADFVSQFATNQLQNVAGSQLKKIEIARQRVDQYLKDWDKLGHRASTLLWSQIRKGGKSAKQFESTLRALANAKDDKLTQLMTDALGEIEFFNSPFGLWVETMITGSALGLLTNNTQLKQLRESARTAVSILDGKTLDELIKYVDEKLNLNLIKDVIDQAQFKNLQPWFKKKLSQFLAKEVDLAGLEKARATLKTITDKADELYASAIKALNDTYTAAFHFTWSSVTTRSALLDINFDFEANPALSALMIAAINGDLNTLLQHSSPGVTLNEATLTHGLKRQTHVNISLPHFEGTIDHINESLARMTVKNEQGRLLVYEVNARDEIVAQRKWVSSLILTGKLTINAGKGVRSFLTAEQTADDMSFTYRFRQAKKQMRASQLIHQIQPLKDVYFRRAFGGAQATEKASLEEFVGDLDNFADEVEKRVSGASNGTGALGATLIGLEVSVPGRAIAAWLEAPENKKAKPYMEMSRHIQRVLRRLVPFCYFQDPERYVTTGVASAVMVYQCLPVSSDIKIDNDQLFLDQSREIYWDVFDSEKRRAMVFKNPASGSEPSTATKLFAEMARVRALMGDSPALRGDADFYAPDQLGQRLKDGFSSHLLANSLLFVEAEVIKQARDAGRLLCKFQQNAAADPEKALAALAEFGAKLAGAFHKNLGSLFNAPDSPNTLRELSGVIFLEASRAFDPTLLEISPAARLEITLLRQSATPDVLAGFLEGKGVDENLIAISQPVVGLSA